jgi:hypothetical protein
MNENCTTNNHRVVTATWCATCRGAKGGQARTPKKIRASRRNMKAARRARHLGPFMLGPQDLTGDGRRGA